MPTFATRAHSNIHNNKKKNDIRNAQIKANTLHGVLPTQHPATYEYLTRIQR